MKKTDTPRDWKVLAVYAQAPDSKRFGVVFSIEGQHWIVTFAECQGDHRPGLPGRDERLGGS